jgi:hypothetical protein
MKKLLFIFSLFISTNAMSGIYTNNNNFKPYIGIDFGFNIANYNYQTDLDDIYYSITANAGAKIGHNFGIELFFSQSSTNDLEYISELQAQNHEFYYQSFGFDIFAYYPVTYNFDFFTSFGVANYITYNKYEYIGLINDNEKIKENDVTSRFGIGVIYTFPGEKISGLFQYQYIPVNNELINTMSEFSIGMRYIF